MKRLRNVKTPRTVYRHNFNFSLHFENFNFSLQEEAGTAPLAFNLKGKRGTRMEPPGVDGSDSNSDVSSDEDKAKQTNGGCEELSGI